MVDLIPAEYRKRLQAQRLLRGFGWSCLAIVLAFGVSYATLARALNTERAALARNRQLQAQNSARLARLAELQAQEQNAAEQLRALAALRGDAAIYPLFDAIDTAINASVWFSELEFSRSGRTGTELPTAGGDSRGGQTEIRGVAADHAALADFIGLLGSRPGVIEVSLRDSSTRSYPGFQVVDFHLTALIGATTGTPK